MHPPKKITSPQACLSEEEVEEEDLFNDPVERPWMSKRREVGAVSGVGRAVSRIFRISVYAVQAITYGTHPCKHL
jgi:hypothetical protein